MRPGRSIALLALPVAAYAVSLSNFQSPQDTLTESDFPPHCARVYNSTINGCVDGDFPSGGNGCSEACAQAMQNMVGKVERACGNKGLKGISIVTTFLNGDGPAAVCGTTAGNSDQDSISTATSTPTTSSSSQGPQDTSGTSSSVSTSTATSSAPTTISSVAVMPVQTSILVTTSTSTTTLPSSSGIAGLGQSGQGSPFDISGSSDASWRVVPRHLEIGLVAVACSIVLIW